MPWHLSRSDPRKIYDERHFDVCVCNNPDQACLIVRAVNELQKENGPVTQGATVPIPDAVTKPDLAMLHEKAQGAGPSQDSAFAVSRRR